MKTNLLIEGLQDYVSVGNVHSAFFGRDAANAPPIPQVQRKTLDMIRELLTEGLFVAGMPTRKGDFIDSELSLEAVMAEIERVYVGDYDDRWGWRHIVWLRLTEKGQELAKHLYFE